MTESQLTAGGGERIGPYLLVELLGEGGMGVVYRAEQLEPVKRWVALKVIRSEIASPEVIGRFENERQALAVMEHPAIAKVLDGGTTPAGNPYFVMEHVEGLPFTTYCDAQQLSPRERLELFVPVCEAIQHAHQKGVIHRDLKPSNVLVTEQAGRPQPIVIDFGIAKAVGHKLTERTLTTEFGAIMGTPAYMSPEQADGSGLDVDTRTDVYSLGVMLYETLVGKLPVDPNEVGFMPFLAQLLSRETSPPTPSARVSKMNGDRAELAARRGIEPRKFASELAGDLDWIVMKAIDPERDRRYETAQALRLDLERYLRDEPIEARPPRELGRGACSIP